MAPKFSIYIYYKFPNGYNNDLLQIKQDIVINLLSTYDIPDNQKKQKQNMS